MILDALANAVSARTGKPFTALGRDASAIMDRIAAAVPGYSEGIYSRLDSGVSRTVPEAPLTASRQTVRLPSLPEREGALALTTSRSLYTSRDGSAIHSPDADKLHREEFIELNPEDAAAMGIGQNRPVLVRNGSHELLLSAALTDAVARGSAYLPFYFDGGAVNRLMSRDEPFATVIVSPA